MSTGNHGDVCQCVRCVSNSPSLHPLKKDKYVWVYRIEMPDTSDTNTISDATKLEKAWDLLFLNGIWREHTPLLGLRLENRRYCSCGCIVPYCTVVSLVSP